MRDNFSKISSDLKRIAVILQANSLHDRRFMSQAGGTRYLARSATRVRSVRRGKEKNISLFFSSPRVVLRAKYRVHLPWLIKRLSCRLAGKVSFKAGCGRGFNTTDNEPLAWFASKPLMTAIIAIDTKIIPGYLRTNFANNHLEIFNKLLLKLKVTVFR